MSENTKKEFGVTTKETKTCEICGELGDPGHMARIFEDKKAHWIHDSCGMELLKEKNLI